MDFIKSLVLWSCSGVGSGNVFNFNAQNSISVDEAIALGVMVLVHAPDSIAFAGALSFNFQV